MGGGGGEIRADVNREGGGGIGLGGQGGCERRIEVFGKIHKKNLGGGGGGKVGGRVGGGVRVDVNTMLGIGGDGGMLDVNQE